MAMNANRVWEIAPQVRGKKPYIVSYTVSIEKSDNIPPSQWYKGCFFSMSIYISDDTLQRIVLAETGKDPDKTKENMRAFTDLLLKGIIPNNDKHSCLSIKGGLRIQDYDIRYDSGKRTVTQSDLSAEARNKIVMDIISGNTERAFNMVKAILLI